MRVQRSCRVFVLLFIISLAILAVGCGGSSVTVNPDFNHRELRQPELRRDGLCVVKVTDNRPDTSSQIGIAQVGMFNKNVPYNLAGSLSRNVKTMLDTLIGSACARDRYVPVTVTIDTFEVGERTSLFSEKAFFNCRLRFMYPVSQDSMASFAISSHPTDGGMDVTNAIEPLIYKGMAECARLFVEQAFDKSPGVPLSTDSVLAVHSAVSAAPPAAARPPAVGAERTIMAKQASEERNELGLHFSSGGKVMTGIRGTFGILTEGAESNLRWGVGLSFTYNKIENREESIAGTFANFGGRLMGRYYFGKKTSLYIGAGLGLTGGNEKIDYGTFTEESFFLGPNLEEVIGISLNRKLFLEVGTYQLRYFGSKMLPIDIGVIGGLSVGL